MTKAATPATPEPTNRDLVVAKVTDAYEAARDKTSGAALATYNAFEANPLAALLGGLALGAAAGALLPRSKGEKALLAPLGETLATAATAAIAAGRAAGEEAIKGSDLDTEALRERVSGLFGQATKAAGAAGTAAFTAAREAVGK